MSVIFIVGFVVASVLFIRFFMRLGGLVFDGKGMNGMLFGSLGGVVVAIALSAWFLERFFISAESVTGGGVLLEAIVGTVSLVGCYLINSIGYVSLEESRG